MGYGICKRLTGKYSFRGRGRSASPETGYDLIHHVSDLRGLVACLGLSKFHLFAYSRGVSYALAFAYQHEELLQTLIVQDYPAMHLQMSAEWAEDYIHAYLIPFHRMNHISEHAVRKIAAESTQVMFHEPLRVPSLVLRGMLAGSLLAETDVLHYQRIIASITMESFQQSAHDIRGAEKERHLMVIRSWLADSEEM